MDEQNKREMKWTIFKIDEHKKIENGLINDKGEEVLRKWKKN